MVEVVLAREEEVEGDENDKRVLEEVVEQVPEVLVVAQVGLQDRDQRVPHPVEHEVEHDRHVHERPVRREQHQQLHRRDDVARLQRRIQSNTRRAPHTTRHDTHVRPPEKTLTGGLVFEGMR